MAEVQTHTQAGEMTQVFIEFVMMHAQNAALFLGQIPNPRGGEVELNLPLAKMFIDQLAVIRARTQGNLKADELKVIDSALSQLQLAFSEVTQMVRAENLGAELPALLTVTAGPAGPSPAPAAPVAPAPIVEAPKPVPVEEPAPRPPSEPEEGRKRFTKSYGS